MSLNLLGKRKFSDIESDEYYTLLYSVLSCEECHNSLIVRRYPNGTYAPICSLQPHCKRCKPYVDCRDEQCPVCCLPESGEPVSSFSELVSAGVMRVKIHDLPVSFSAEPCTAMVVSGSSSSGPGPASVEPCTAMVVSGSASNEPGPASVEPGPASVEPCTAMVVAGSASAEPSMVMLGTRTSSRRVHIKPRTIHFNEQGFFQIIDIYNKFVACVHDKLFSGDAAAMGGAAAAMGGAAAGASATDFEARLKKLEAGPGYTREDFEKLKKEYDVSKPWTEEERAQWDQLPFILRKLQMKLNFNNNLFFRRITKLDQRTVELKQETTKLKQALASDQQATSELKQALAKEQQATAELKQALAAEQLTTASQAEEIASLMQATASQAQEIAALKLAMATQGQAVQSMDAHTAQIMQAVQAMMGPMRDELVELRQRVAVLESARPAGLCAAVKQIKKEPA